MSTCIFVECKFWNERLWGAAWEMANAAVRTGTSGLTGRSFLRSRLILSPRSQRLRNAYPKPPEHPKPTPSTSCVHLRQNCFSKS